MNEVLLWLYLIHAVLLINHEIDSAYWKEWELFRLPGGIAGFLLLHLPLLFFILYGLVLIARQSAWGFVFSLLLSAGGLFAFSIHAYFLKQGRREFDQPVSKYLLTAIGGVAALQLAVTVYMIMV